MGVVRVPKRASTLPKGGARDGSDRRLYFVENVIEDNIEGEYLKGNESRGQELGEKERRLAHLERGACAKGGGTGKGKDRSV